MSLVTANTAARLVQNRQKELRDRIWALKVIREWLQDPNGSLVAA